MKILFVFHNVYFFRYFDGVVRHLRSMGHEVILTAGTQRMMSKGYTDRAFRQCIEDTKCQNEPLILPGGISKVPAILRDIIGYSNFFRSGHPSPAWGLKWKNYLPRSVKILANIGIIDKLLRREKVRNILQAFEQNCPPERKVINLLKNDPPNVVVACPFIWTLSADADYIKAARRLGIPTVAAVGSWDHLSGKGHFPIVPDLTLVWNEEMAQEAMLLQDVPAEKISITGAPPFDFWFNAKPRLDAKSFHAKAGLDMNNPYVVFLCSSKPISGLDEPRVIKDFVNVLQGTEKTRGLQILVRPYPSLADLWTDVKLPNTVVWPKDGEWPDIDSARQNLFDTVFYSTAVIGINTTAMIEAVVAGKPCIAIMTEEFKGSQSGRAHFQQLLRGEFLEIASTYEETQQILENLLTGIDNKAPKREAFVKRFIRPQGINYSAAMLAANAIEMIADGRSAQFIQDHLKSGNLSDAAPGKT